jgi:flagellar basal body rod protein FlgC
MAAFQIKDVYAIMNTLARQATGQTNIDVVDHSGFIDAGTTTLATGTENVLNSIYRTIAELRVQSRPYVGKFGLISADENKFNTRKAKISYYSSDVEASGAFNTDANTNLANGYDNGTNSEASVGSMWEQRLPKVVERFFLKEAVYDKGYTTPLAQLQNAFNNEAEFLRFWNGVMIEIDNDIETVTESRNRSVVADRIAGDFLVGNNGSKVNLTKLVNDEFGTSYTTQQILESYNKELLEIWVSYIKIISDRMTERTVKYHDPMTIAATESEPAYNVLRHTPKSMQKLFYFGELMSKAKTKVMPEIFNTEYLDIANGESVTYWQSSDDDSRMKIKCKPALPEGATANSVELDNVVGILFDTDAIQSTRQFEGAYTTPVEARKLYTNTWTHWKFGVMNDYTENSVIFYLADENEASFTGDGTAKTFTVSAKPAVIDKVIVAGEEVAIKSYLQSTGVVTLNDAPANNAVVKIYYEA